MVIFMKNLCFIFILLLSISSLALAEDLSAEIAEAEKQLAAGGVEYQDDCHVPLQVKDSMKFKNTGEVDGSIQCGHRGLYLTGQMKMSLQGRNYLSANKSEISQDPIQFCSPLWGKNTYGDLELEQPQGPEAERVCAAAEINCEELVKAYGECDETNPKLAVDESGLLTQDFELTIVDVIDGAKKTHSICKKGTSKEDCINLCELKILNGSEDESGGYAGLKACRETFASQIIKNTVVSCHSLQVAASSYNMEHGADKVASFDGKYHCEKNSAFNIDFKSCKAAVMAYNGLFVTEQAGELTDQIVTGSKQVSYTKEIAESENLQLTAVETQRKMMNHKGDSENVKGGLQTAKAATLGGLVWSWTRPSTIESKCKDKSCCQAAAAYHEGTLFKNYNTKVAMLREVFKAAGKAASHFVLGKAYKDMSKNIKDIEDELKNEFDEVNTAGVDVTTGICDINPGHASCRLGRGARTNHAAAGFNGMNIDSGMNGYNSNDGFNPLDGGDNFSNQFDGLSDDEKTELAAKIAATAPGKGGFVDSGPAAARFKSGPGAPGSGTGGGGGGASASGLGAAPKSDGDDKSSILMNNGAKIGYGNSKGAAYTGGSYSRKTSKKSAAANPFANAFGKKDDKSGVVRRDLASDIGKKEGSGIFEKISRRYNSISDSRLMKYDVE